MVRESILTDILRRKFNEAELNPGRSTTPHDLKNGLRIVIRKDGPQSYKLYISRPGVIPPSKTELQTILDNWPQVINAPKFESARSGITIGVNEKNE